MPETILVVGATGMLGRPVARRLAADGFSVRVFSRRPDEARASLGADVEVVSGNVDDIASLRAGMDGCDRLHISLDGHGDWDLERRGAVNAARAASELGLRRISYISGASVSAQNCWFPMTLAKFQAEAAIRESGVPFTFFRCSMFMETLPRFVRGERATLIGRQPHAWHFLAAEDYARMVSLAHARDEAAGKALFIYGPEALTIRQALESYCRACAPQARVAAVPFWLVWLMARLPGRRSLRDVGLPLMRYFSKVGEAGDPDAANALLGAPTTKLESWCRQRV